MRHPFSHRIGSTLAIALVAVGAFGAFAPLAMAAAGDDSKTATAPYDPTIVDKTLGLVMNKIASLFAWLLGVAAITLDYVVFYTVVKMGDFVSSVQGVENIGIAWRVLRDIGNIALIFGFLASGIAIIVNSSFYGFGSKMLPMLLVAAVFINFSLFISSAIIDVGNVFATQIFAQINNGKVPTPKSMEDGLFKSVSNEGISNRIMSVLGLAQIYQIGASDSSKTDSSSGKITGGVLNGSGPWYVGFMAIILFITAAFVFFSLAFILVARFVALIFLIIVAPLGFAGLAIPNLSGLAKQWWKYLVEQTLTAPVLLLLLYIALAVITDAKFLLRAGGWTTNATNAGSAWQGFLNTGNVANFGNFFSILVSFIIAMGLLLAVIVVAKRLSAFGASSAMKLGGMASFGAVAWGGRMTAGNVGNILTSKRMMAKARTSLGARALVFAGRGLRGGTYDLRNMPGVGGGLGAVGAGKGSTLTPRQLWEQRYGVRPVQKWMKESKAEYETAGREMDFNDALRNQKAADDSIKTMRAGHAAGRVTAADLATAEAQYRTDSESNERVITQGLAKMSTKEIEALGGIKQGVDALVTNLSPQQFENLMKSDKLTDAEKGNIKDARYRTFSSAVASGSTADVKKALNAMSKGEIESMPSGLLVDPIVLDQLSDNQRTTITDSKERTAAEKDAVRAASPNGRVEGTYKAAKDANIAAGMSAADAAEAAARTIGITAAFRGLNSPQRAKLDKEILLQPDVVVQLGPADLVKLQEENKFTSTEMGTIGNIIRRNPGARAHAYISGPGGALWT